MFDLIIFFSLFYVLLISVIGFGILFQNIIFGTIKNMNDQSTIYTGFYGLFLLTFISQVTSLFVSHNYTHNILLHLIGLLLFIFIKIKNKKTYLKFIFLISAFLISALLISKTHDDFSYYHLPFTKYLTEQKVIFGMGNLGHGYKLLSSLFFLNSTFYLPYIEYFSFHFSLIFFLIFFNFFLLKEIFSKNTHEVIKFLYLFAFSFFNLSFNRIAEYGTDKVGQLLIVILTIKLFQHTCYDKNKLKIKNILFLIPLIGLCISLKTYFLPYILLGLTIILIDFKFFKNLKKIFYSKPFFIFTITLIICFFHHFISTGCIVSPISATCLGNNLDWAYSANNYERFSKGLELWAKAGRGPGFKVENAHTYMENFNWISRWYTHYFLGKFLDQLLLLTSVFFVIFLLFKNFKYKKKLFKFGKKHLFFFIFIITIFLIWFLKHPQLRYGGYPIVFLTVSIPVAIIFQKVQNKTLYMKNFKYLILLVFIVFNFKNFNRINKEFKRTDYYKFDNFPFYSIPDKEFIAEKFPSGLTIYKTKGHCWNVPSPCKGNLKNDIEVKINKGYYFLYKF